MQALLNAPIRLHVGSEVQAARADTLWSFDATVTPAAPQREDGGAVPRSSRIPVNSLPRAAESPSSRCWFGAGPSPRGYSHAVNPGLKTCPATVPSAVECLQVTTESCPRYHYSLLDQPPPGARTQLALPSCPHRAAARAYRGAAQAGTRTRRTRTSPKGTCPTSRPPA